MNADSEVAGTFRAILLRWVDGAGDDGSVREVGGRANSALRWGGQAVR